MIEDLVANKSIFVCDAPGFREVGTVEVAHTPGEDLPLTLLKCSDRVFKRLCATPVQKITVESIGV